jgi:hypothetical protein
MISDRDVWQAALLIVKRYGDDAMLEASERADQLQRKATWPAPRRGTGSSTRSSGCRPRRRRMGRRPPV